MKLTVLNPYQPEQRFPAVERALTDPEGLLAVGGCLSTIRIVNAYRHGIFPWFNPDDPILWWSPNPRFVLYPEQLIISRSLAKTLRSGRFTFSVDRAFDLVIAGCAQARVDSGGTWITDGIQQAYRQLHQQGIAHSAEAWFDGELVGGLYGVAMGQVFFGESMFHRKTDASKVAFAQLVGHLQNWGYQLIDCQVYTEHLESLGARKISRPQFIGHLKHYCELPVDSRAWYLT